MAENSERWLPIPGHPGYEVSDLGRVRSVDRVIVAAGPVHGPHEKVLRGKIRSLRQDRNGRWGLPLPLPSGGDRSLLVHVLVLTAFVGPRPSGTVGCHNDGDPSNNVLSNLRWDTWSENSLDSVRHGTHSNAQKTHCKRGHEFTPENTISRPNRRGCRECQRKAVREAMRRRRALTKEAARGATGSQAV